MAYNGIRPYIQLLEKENDLIRIDSFVDTELEITEITDRFCKLPDGGKAILFENNGTKFPLLINLFGSEKRMAEALGANSLDSISERIGDLFKELTKPRNSLSEKLRLLPTLKDFAQWMPKRKNIKGKCQEVKMPSPDITQLPVLKCWPADGGKFITLPMVNTIDPITGSRNVGMYRMQIFDKTTTGMHWHMHKTGARHYEEYKKKGMKMPVTVTLGGDPAYTFAATAPLPDNIDEYILAGFLRNKKVELVKCITNDIWVPSDVDFVIEGYVDPEEELVWEGPFGDHTGFYSLEDWYPKFHITCITHRQDAIYPATIVGIPPMEDAYIAMATEKIFLNPIRFAIVPEIVDLHIPFSGVGHNITIVSIRKGYPGQALKVMNALWGAGQMMFNKCMVVTSDDVNIHNYNEVCKAIIKNTSIPGDFHITKGPMDVLDHASIFKAFGGKIGIDATNKLPEEINNNESGITNKHKDKSNTLTEKHLFIDEFGLLCVFADNCFDINTLNDDIYHKTGARFIVLFDSKASELGLNDLTWIAGNNVDPIRDIKININNTTLEKYLLVDARTKYSNEKEKIRQWPNLITMSETVINKIDDNWGNFGLNNIINSPSLKYLDLKYGENAAIYSKKPE